MSLFSLLSGWEVEGRQGEGMWGEEGGETALGMGNKWKFWINKIINK